MNIVTTLKTDHKGNQKILAKGGGKQRTVTATSERSEAGNHGLAAAELALVHGLEWHDNIQHEVKDGSHVFIF